MLGEGGKRIGWDGFDLEESVLVLVYRTNYFLFCSFNCTG
jgi:hypothetical protein